MADTREKRVELMFVGQVLADAECDKQAECNKCPYNAPNACRVGFIADHLIANDVIVLPCKVGDTVYVIRECSCYNDPNSMRKHRKKCAEKVYLRKRAKKLTYCGYVSKTKFNLKHLADFGKNVFLTKEDADAELNRRKEHEPWII